MSRCLVSLFALLLLVLPTFAQPPRPAIIERAAALQRAMADARDALATQRPAEASALLEAHLTNAEGNKAFLGLLRDVYTEELKAMGPTAPRAALVRERLILLGGTPPTAEATAAPMAVPVERDFAREAAVAFQKQNWSEAAALFAQVKEGGLTKAETEAWEFCKKQGVTTPSMTAGPASEVAATPGVIETESFRIRYTGDRTAAESLAKAVEAKRKELFARWSGPVNDTWEPKCEIVLHADSAAYGQATKRPAGGSGHATIRFTGGKVSERRLDLRADDVALMDDALPRELMHVILSDLFPTEAPPLWAEAGMAVLTSSAAEVERYSRTLHRCARDSEIFGVAALMELKTYPAADRITAFYCQSVSLVQYLVKLRGEKNFTIFLRDSKRYGLSSALKKTYEFDLAGLEQSWRQQVLSNPRAQSE